MPCDRRGHRRRALALGACIAAVAGCGGSSDPVVARVAGQEIHKSALDDTVTHFRAEAKREGHDFPKPGTRQFRITQWYLLNTLIVRAEYRVAAAKLGIHVSDADVQRRLSAGSSSDPGEGPDAFSFESVRQQLITERVSAKVARGVSVSDAAVRAYYRAHITTYGGAKLSAVAASIRSELLSERRQEAYDGWVASFRNKLDPTVKYAKGYGKPPGIGGSL